MLEETRKQVSQEWQKLRDLELHGLTEETQALRAEVNKYWGNRMRVLHNIIRLYGGNPIMPQEDYRAEALRKNIRTIVL